MRIVSLLPSLTELVCALGHGDDLVGVSHECDYPPGVEKLPHLTRGLIPQDADSATIDRLVAELRGSLYTLDDALLADLKPDLILTQEQCDVCAVNEATVRRAAANLPGNPHVESVNPLDLAGLHAMFRSIGDLLGAREPAEALIAAFQSTAAEIGRRIAGRPPRPVLLLEWLDPPYSAGHWNPELVELAGGIDVIGRPGQPSRRITWEAIHAADPDLILVTPCGFTLDRARQEFPTLAARPEWTTLRAVRTDQVALADGSAYFSRPGPRLESSLRIAAAALHPDICGDLADDCDWVFLD
jgi:iron complex transport system substrate-binding protein